MTASDHSVANGAGITVIGPLPEPRGASDQDVRTAVRTVESTTGQTFRRLSDLLDGGER
jgi:hypothetical protein